ncbi:GNAT family N-acetyltransferase [Gryllotalpicola sp.]|uniref:GNAT family N-acetyltransferase n=1 Tax=Gryllotalpicola sp. TaxID=1932787 RepID=UPI002616BA75|nr:GNAT family N-acetyltransferase [Gryllotalpicola sp.]
MVTLRNAERSDLEQIVTVFTDCWRISYPAALPEELVATMTPEKARSLWADALTRRASPIVVAVSDADLHEVCGFVGFRLEPDDVGYVSSLYVSPFLQGGGAGRLLLAAAETRLYAMGAATGQLWVFQQNAPSIAFYRRQGWEPDGRVETLAEWGQPQLGMAKTLGG